MHPHGTPSTLLQKQKPEQGRQADVELGDRCASVHFSQGIGPEYEEERNC